VTHAPNEEELALEVTSQTHLSAIPFPCTLKQLAILADRASLFVGGDTGPLHLAAARGTPIVAIFGATLARRNGPFSPEDVVVQDPEAVPDAYYRRANDDRYINVSVDQVRQAIERRLARASKPRPHHYAQTAADGSS
jgi:ADP-heptose:LPS heptosyltransferase